MPRKTLVGRRHQHSVQCASMRPRPDAAENVSLQDTSTAIADLLQ